MTSQIDEKRVKNSFFVDKIPISQIVISELNIRKDLSAGSEDSTLDDLARSINENGLLNPITVLERGGKYEVIVGQRRYLACQLLGWLDIPAFVRTNLDNVDARILSLIENVHRADLSPMDKARAYDEIYKIYGPGVSTRTIKRYILLMTLSPTIQTLLNTTDGPAGICSLSRLAEFFPSHEDQEYVLDKITGLRSQIQEEIIMRSGGDKNKIDGLVEQALGGAFNIVICRGLESCPFIPEKCLNDIKFIISRFTENIASIEKDTECIEVK
jgi:ParB family chromosome partitioning protein